MAAATEARSASTLHAASVPHGKLSPGPGLSAQEVANHQRGRIQAAMIEIVGGEGYGAVTVRRLAQQAGVSTRTFYVHFEGKEECFHRTYEGVVDSAAERVAEAQEDDGDWRNRLQRAFEALTREIATRPSAARFALVEAFSAGPAVLERVRSTEQTFEAVIAKSLGRADDDVELSPLLVKGIVAGISSVAQSRLLAGREHELPSLVGELLEWTLAFYSEAILELAKLDRSLARRSFSEPSYGGKPLVFGRASKPKGDERDLILSAVSKLAFAEGPSELSVPNICAAAGIRRRAFDAYFEGVTDCFLTALELRTYQIFEYANRQAMSDSDWAGNVHRVTTALCGQIVIDPLFTKFAFTKAFATGQAGIRCRDGIMDAIAGHFRASGPAAQRPSKLSAEASVSAIWGVLHHYVISGRAQQLSRLMPTLSFLALAPAIGARNAAENICMEMGA